jgi:hypothetical protein
MSQTTSGTKPAILIYGNRQAERLAHIAAHLPGLREKFDIEVVTSLPSEETSGATPSDAPISDNVRVVWHQIEPGEPTAHWRTLERCIPPGGQIVTFPALSLFCQWPFIGADPRQTVLSDVFYPWPDAIAASLAQEELADDALFERYMQLTADRMPDLDRRLRIDATRSQAMDARADVKLWDWIQTNIRTRAVFDAPTLPTVATTGHLLKQLLERTDRLTSAEHLRARQETDFLLRDYSGRDTEMLPIHPLVAARLGLTWYDPDRMHRWHGHEWTFREYIVKYIRWEPFLV